MSIFDAAYDEMSLSEVCYRLPGELAVRSLKRRIDNLPTLLDFIKTIGTQPNFVPELKTHINGIISNEAVADIIATFDKSLHSSLFGWLDDSNKARIKNEGRASLDVKLLFNLADEKDLDDLKYVLDSVLKDPTLRTSQIHSVLNKAEHKIFPQLMDMVAADPRPEVKECILAVRSNNDLISDHQRTVALKAFVKSTNRLPYLNKQNFKSFSALKPKERLDALNKYFNYFPSYRQIEIFEPSPTQEEFDMIVFAGCLEYNDLVVSLSSRYKQITQEEAPLVKEEDDDGDDV